MNLDISYPEFSFRGGEKQMNQLKKRKYTCPYCNEEQTTIINWANVLVAFEHNLDTKAIKQVDKCDGCEHASWSCPSCGKTLSDGFVRELNIDVQE